MGTVGHLAATSGGAPGRRMASAPAPPPPRRRRRGRRSAPASTLLGLYGRARSGDGRRWHADPDQLTNELPRWCWLETSRLDDKI
jgi:hypothetical protein